jgi:hypothetical protein
LDFIFLVVDSPVDKTPRLPVDKYAVDSIHMEEAMSTRKTDGNLPRIIARIPTDSRVERVVKSAHSIPYRKYNRATGLRVPIPGDGG